MNRFFSQFILIALFISSLLFSQKLDVSGKIVAKYGRGRNYIFDKEYNKFNFDEYRSDLNLYYKGYEGWFQLEFSNPPEYGRDVNTLRRFRISKLFDKLSIEVGDIYKTWGHGLMLSQFDDQEINFDNSVRGLSANFETDKYSVEVLGGHRKQNQSTPFNINLRVHDEKSDHLLGGLRLGYLSDKWSINLNFLSTNKQFYPKRYFLEEDGLNIQNQLIGFNSSLTNDSWDFSTEFAYKYSSTDNDLTFSEFKERKEFIIPRDNLNGISWYANFNKYLGNWSLTFDYKQYRLSDLNPNQKIEYPLPENGLIYQNPPLSFYEHSSTLLNRNIHPLDKSNEIGYQINLIGLVRENSNLLLNYSQGSRISIWKQEFVPNQRTWIKDKSLYVLPSTDPSSEPFKEIFGEFSTYLLDDKVAFTVGVSYSDQIISILNNIKSADYDSSSYEYVSAYTFPLEADYKLNNKYSIEVKYQIQIAEKGIERVVRNSDGTNSDVSSLYFSKDEDGQFKFQDNQISQILQFGLSKSGQYGVNFLIDTDKYFEGGLSNNINESNPLESAWEKLGFSTDLTWLSMEILYNLTSKARLNIYYGSDKGGLQCRNGICRTVQPFNDGVKVTLTTLF